MRRGTALILIGGLAVFALAGIGISRAHLPCGSDPSTHTHTWSGSCKEAGSVKCGSTSLVPLPSAGSIRFSVNPRPSAPPTASGAEVEGCDETQGQFIAHADTLNGARLTLNSDASRTDFPPGYINVQASSQTTGVYCSEDTGADSSGDGYARPWSEPGGDGVGVTGAGAVNNNNEGSDLPFLLECAPGIDPQS